MSERINSISCTFENHAREDEFYQHSWIEKSKSIIINLVVYALTGLIFFVFSFFDKNLDTKIGLTLCLVNLFGTGILFYKGDNYRKKYTHYIVTIMNFFWIYGLTFSGFLDNILSAWFVIPIAFLIYNVKVFPFNFLWCVIPGTFGMLVAIIYTAITTSQYSFSGVSQNLNLFYVSNSLLWFVIIYDKWRFEKSIRGDFLKTETIDSTKKLMHETLKRYFGQTLSNKILEEKGELKGEIKWVSISFTDISSYSTIIENMSPEVAVTLLNEYFTKMHEVIEKFGGHILNYIGDAIMVIYGAPNKLADHEVKAVECAIEMKKALRELNNDWDKREFSRYWKNYGIDKVTARTGIHTGSIIAGNIGSNKMLQYSAIGDVVNVASRLEQANKEFSSNISMSQEIYINLTKKLHDSAILAGTIKLKGRSSPSKVYSI